MKNIGFFLMAFIVVIFTSTSSNVSAASFPDVKKNKEEIGYLADKNIVGGYPDGLFRPAIELTRLQGVRVLLKAKDITNLTAPNPKFTDMSPSSNGYADVAKAVQLGIISGKTKKDGSKYFDPSGKLTRGQMAKIIVETMGYKINTSNSFRDLPKTSGYYNYVSTLAAERITEGYEDRTFRPNETVTRQHFSVFVARMLEDKFKPAPRPSSYLMDNTKDYSWEYQDKGKTYLSKVSYIGRDSYDSDVNWDVWQESSSNDEVYRFLVREDKEALYLGYPNSYFNIEIAYPMYAGKKFEDWASSDTYTIVSINRVVTTKAGTFNNVVEVRSGRGATYYYAPNVGHIKSVESGKTFAELVKLSPRR